MAPGEETEMVIFCLIETSVVKAYKIASVSHETSI
jgi:hypothetical protein